MLVAVGDHVTTESALAEVLTDKATVEISSPVAGVVTYLRGEPGEKLAVGSELVGVELDGSVAFDAPAPGQAEQRDEAKTEPAATPTPVARPKSSSSPAGRPAAAPTVRQRAREMGIDLASVHGSGPNGRIVHADPTRSAHPQRDAPRRATHRATSLFAVSAGGSRSA